MFKYIYGLFVVFFIYLVGSEIYSSINKKGGKSTRLECHSRSTTFEHIYDNQQIKDIQEAFKSGQVDIKSKFKLSKHMKSELSTHVKLENVDKMIRDEIMLHSTKEQSSKKLLIDYFIYENDKADPGKKTEKSKLYAGYLRLYFILDDKKVYHIQIDFMDLQGADIEEKIACVTKSLLSLS